MRGREKMWGDGDRGEGAKSNVTAIPAQTRLECRETASSYSQNVRSKIGMGINEPGTSMRKADGESRCARLLYSWSSEDRESGEHGVFVEKS